MIALRIEKLTAYKRMAMLKKVPLNPFCGPGSGIRCFFKFSPLYPRSSAYLETIFGLKILKFFDADPGWKNSTPGSGINIPDPQHGKPSVRHVTGTGTGLLGEIPRVAVQKSALT